MKIKLIIKNIALGNIEEALNAIEREKIISLLSQRSNSGADLGALIGKQVEFIGYKN